MNNRKQVRVETATFPVWFPLSTICRSLCLLYCISFWCLYALILLLPLISLICQALIMRLFPLEGTYRNKILLCVIIDKSQLFRIVPAIEETLNEYMWKEQRQAGRKE